VANIPDIVVNETNNDAFFIDVAVPNSNNLHQTYCIELQNTCNLLYP
jgi:hypothetical protein